MIADFETYYGYDIDDEFANEGKLAEVLNQYEAHADCGELLYCRDFILIPDYDSGTVGLVIKPSEPVQLKAYLETREYFLDEAKHKIWDYSAFEIWMANSNN